MFRQSLVAKRNSGGFARMGPLLRAGIDYDWQAALEWLEESVICHFRNDDGTRVLRRG